MLTKNHSSIRSISALPIKTILRRSFETTSVIYGKANFRKFPIPNKRGVFEHPRLPKPLLENEFDYPVAVDEMRIRYPGVWFRKKFQYVREMEPELIVPDDFEQCPLKPYVSYRTDEIEQSEFTVEDLFNATYGKEILECMRNNQKIPESLLSHDPQASQEAKLKAIKIGSDLFSHTSYFGSLK
ncbi:39S ribosomal protein L41 [Sarcoptes scabiei]|uniref:39S ribosomal protein L41, mitochondrial n=1 Tax=Sarcoptes scabiei TaxID=52283 RepID=A0A132AEK3_SARSC|nr:39S ribosomal protein L41 [Sarcoptes scabiei]KPM09412.1 39S ribosomal protein L41, mitochondrial-like protein [Sarcoptes scabiei]UXI20297.1 hypothetical protein NH340_JMT06240 [Sarcoptes scabiei]